MATFEFSKVNDPTNTIGKHIAPTAIVTGSFTKSCDILNPVIEVVGVDATNYNYCRIVELNRYYFIDNVSINPFGMYICNCSVDVLQTYADELKALIQNQPAPTVQTFNDVFNHDGVTVLVAAQGGLG